MAKRSAIEADVTDRAAAEALVERTVSELGRLDTVVNNAGVMLLGPALDADIEEWERMVDLNVKGLLYVSKAALPHLIKAADEEPRQVADLVNISSVAGRRPRSRPAPSTTRPSSASAPSPRRSARRSPSATCASPWSSRAP